MFFQLEKRSNDAKGRIDEDAGLRDHQEQVVQLQFARSVVPENPGL